MENKTLSQAEHRGLIMKFIVANTQHLRKNIKSVRKGTRGNSLYYNVRFNDGSVVVCWMKDDTRELAYGIYDWGVTTVMTYDKIEERFVEYKRDKEQ